MSDNKVTLDQLDNSAVEAMAGSIGDVNMLNTENKTIVGALAEIVGKKEIANAIGEPLAETDKFTEMSSEINGLLSTFKTNMMNAGVVVESGDKFKALIDKIKGLTEGEGNKGIQFATMIGSATYSVPSTNVKRYVMDLDIDFIPSYIFVDCQFNYSVDASYTCKAMINNINLPSFQGTNASAKISISSTDLIGNTLTWDVWGYYNLTNIDKLTYYAIGVGEEDTALRDSLASILENKGVDVTEEDDMASLITKVDNLDVKLPSYASFKVVNGASYTFYEYVDSSYWSTSTSFVTRDEYKWIAPADGPYKTYFAASIQPTSDGYVYGSAYYYTISDSDGNVIKTSGTYGSESTGGNGYVISDVVELSKGQILTFYARTQNSAGPFKCASLTIKAGLELIY